MVERFTVNRNRLFLIVPPLQPQLQINGNNSWFYKKDPFGAKRIVSVQVFLKKEAKYCH